MVIFSHVTCVHVMESHDGLKKLNEVHCKRVYMEGHMHADYILQLHFALFKPPFPVLHVHPALLFTAIMACYVLKYQHIGTSRRSEWMTVMRHEEHGPSGGRLTGFCSFTRRTK